MVSERTRMLWSAFPHRGRGPCLLDTIGEADLTKILLILTLIHKNHSSTGHSVFFLF